MQNRLSRNFSSLFFLEYLIGRNHILSHSFLSILVSGECGGECMCSDMKPRFNFGINHTLPVIWGQLLTSLKLVFFFHLNIKKSNCVYIENLIYINLVQIKILV